MFTNLPEDEIISVAMESSESESLITIDRPSTRSFFVFGSDFDELERFRFNDDDDGSDSATFFFSAVFASRIILESGVGNCFFTNDSKTALRK